MEVAIVIPVHNEEQNIPLLVEKLFQLEEDFKVIFVNDNSTDESKKIIQGLLKKDKRIKLVDRKKQEGLGRAIISGLKEAVRIGAIGVITMDGDLSHPVEQIPELIMEGKNYDLVVGSRFIEEGKIKKWNTKKRIMSLIARTASRIILNIKTRDCSSGMKYYSVNLLNFYNFSNFISSGYSFQIETILIAEQNNFKIKEIPITFKGRVYGKSKVNFSEVRRYLKSIWLLRISKG